MTANNWSSGNKIGSSSLAAEAAPRINSGVFYTFDHVIEGFLSDDTINVIERNDGVRTVWIVEVREYDGFFPIFERVELYFVISSRFGEHGVFWSAFYIQTLLCCLEKPKLVLTGMKIFISWSGERSKAVAELLQDWIKCVLQASQPWVSTRDIDRGALWQSQINNQLSDTAIGIVCLTQENKEKPWILFESGALAKGLSQNRVCTFLVDLQPGDVDDPLAQFNHTLPNQSGLRSLVYTLNGCLDTQKLPDRVLERVFDTYWPEFASRFQQALDEHQTL